MDIVEKDESQRFIDLFTSMGQTDSSVDAELASHFVCAVYGQNKTTDVNKARYYKLLQMSGKIDQVNLCTSTLIENFPGH